MPATSAGMTAGAIFLSAMVASSWISSSSSSFRASASGAVYALVALGFVLIFRATNVVNFAQGEFSMVAAYLMVVFAVDLGWPYWLSFLIALGGMALLGAIFNLGVYYPLRHRTYLPVIISTIGARSCIANSTLALSTARSRR